MSTTPHRRWFRFRLRTVFVVVTLLAPLLGWLGWTTRQVHRRVELLHWCAANEGEVEPFSELALPTNSQFAACFSQPAPDIGRLRKWLGDRPVAAIYFETAPLPEMQRELARLFPETSLVAWQSDGSLKDLPVRASD